MIWCAVVLAVLNSCCFAAGTRLQHGGSAEPEPLLRAMRRPRWLAGLALIALGGACQLAAMQLAPLTVVQPVGVLGIVIGVVWGLRAGGVRPGWRTGCGLAAILVGAGTFAVLAALHTVPAPVTTDAQIRAGAAVCAAAVVCRLAGGVLGGRARCLALGVGGGAAYGYASVLARAATERYAEHGVSAGLLGTLSALAATVLIGFWLVQRAYADGPPETTVASITVTDPMVSVAIGIGLLGEAPDLTVPTAGWGLACAALAAAGVVGLARDVPAGRSGNRPAGPGPPPPGMPDPAPPAPRPPAAAPHPARSPSSSPFSSSPSPDPSPSPSPTPSPPPSPSPVLFPFPSPSPFPGPLPHDRSTSWPPVPGSASSSARTRIPPTSTEPPTSPIAWPTVSPAGATTSM
ncbi:hypothetical protein [Streptomyces sp. NPDC048845]|uniref:hypothetical protein n=1 Tax=Streptomyces sp. NPDC048845 TaxID=3155390 RepID=UPI0034191CCB